jgi:hypothetical protein
LTFNHDWEKITKAVIYNAETPIMLYYVECAWSNKSTIQYKPLKYIFIKVQASRHEQGQVAQLLLYNVRVTIGLDMLGYISLDGVRIH